MSSFTEHLSDAPTPVAPQPPATEWRRLPADQQPDWPDPSRLAQVREQLMSAAPLTTPGDVRRLGSALAHVGAGRAFLLQAGDCAEPVGPEGVAAVRGKHRVMGEMAEIISGHSALPTVTVGRIAGQYAKPRSRPQETVGGRVLPVYRGDLVNSPAADEAARVPDPHRLLLGYTAARAVLDELHQIAHETAAAFRARDPQHTTGDTGRPAGAPDGGLRTLIEDYGQTVEFDGRWQHTGLWTSHEALVLDYEHALVRRDAHTGEEYLLSTHLPWVGERTRRIDGAHLAFLAQVANPVACKVGPATRPETLLELCALLDPHRRPGRLTLIGRFGAGQVREVLPALVEAARSAGHDVVWACDPMHGNTVSTARGIKTRRLDDILDEITGFFEVMRRADQWPGGVHLEIAGDDVTECLDADGPESEEGLGRAYRTLCDPRLNDVQALLVARTVSELIAKG
ncbi:3-deoxy-7-phosphoheptulonate synthase [Streptomyces sp. NPDC005925]|uniref:3-deoxy-7-phosphoheptulonate synthase n=1 Tax=Streptomyces sp. NPDC005925 TaxID=3157172 RepID=UPI00340AB653